jgi:hypothetical protein
MIDVGDDGKIADMGEVGHVPVLDGLARRNPWPDRPVLHCVRRKRGV